jgi:putative N-acetylmannosamine-6-phosphate epimerase/predicted NBD/HSP70 family sugar kinase
VDRFVSRLRRQPIVVSVQASNPRLHRPELLRELAWASVQEGAGILRVEGVENIKALQQLDVPVIGLIKKVYTGSEVYITPSSAEVAALLDTGCEVVALDGTARTRLGGEQLSNLIAQIHSAGKLALADCDNVASVRHSAEAGADLISTTLAGYTPDSNPISEPDLHFLRLAVQETDKPVLAEGRFTEPWQVRTALRIGAAGVVIGGAINDPSKNTRRFLDVLGLPEGPIGAVDIGGTWLRFGVFSNAWELGHVERIPLPSSRGERLDWIARQAVVHGVSALGVASGGTIDPRKGLVIESKPIIPDNIGTVFSEATLGLPSIALNDGLATAWGHAHHPALADARVATIALGTGVGCGLVDRGRLVIGPYGSYPRLNDLSPVVGRSYEELLGGAALTTEPSHEAMDAARFAGVRALRTITSMWMPDVVVLSGGVGLSDWLELTPEDQGPLTGQSESLSWPRIMKSPFGADAGLYGAAALVLFPPEFSG